MKVASSNIPFKVSWAFCNNGHVPPTLYNSTRAVQQFDLSVHKLSSVRLHLQGKPSIEIASPGNPTSTSKDAIEPQGAIAEDQQNCNESPGLDKLLCPRPLNFRHLCFLMFEGTRVSERTPQTANPAPVGLETRKNLFESLGTEKLRELQRI